METTRSTRTSGPGPERVPGRGKIAEPGFRQRGATAADWELRPSPKYAEGVVRTVPPAKTIERMLPLLDAIGVTRVADVTGLDRVGVANYTTVRPRELGEGISYYNGKGLTRTAARAGAIMEAAERYSCECWDGPVYYATREEMARRGATVDPAELYAPIVDRYEPELRIEWVEGFDLVSERPTYVPLNAVMCPYEPSEGRPLLFYSSTNGLAAGNTYEEAICSALCEVIERDAEAHAAAARTLAPAVAGVLRDIGVKAPPEAKALARPARFPLIDLDTLPPRLRPLVRKLRRAGLGIYLRDVTSTGGIPTLTCTIVEQLLDGRFIAHGGAGTHPDARVAAARALSEAPQSRLGLIQGGREDLPHIAKPPADFDPDAVFGDVKLRPFWSIRSYEHQGVDEDVRFMLERLAESGLPQVVAFDLTRPEVGVPVVRVVVPGAETWAVFLQHGCSARVGRRAGRVLGAAVADASSHA